MLCCAVVPLTGLDSAPVMRLMRRWDEDTLGSIFSDPYHSAVRGCEIKHTYYYLTLHSLKVERFKPEKRNPSYDQQSNEIWQPWSILNHHKAFP